ncbi:hypothetical protein FOA52_002717 [Chlamydomonas sp. UWO 241]|nr:hypothetical protein FOA52_002717 [Chlamydomonas sp. UWO 241]
MASVLFERLKYVIGFIGGHDDELEGCMEVHIECERYYFSVAKLREWVAAAAAEGSDGEQPKFTYVDYGGAVVEPSLSMREGSKRPLGELAPPSKGKGKGGEEEGTDKGRKRTHPFSAADAAPPPQHSGEPGGSGSGGGGGRDGAKPMGVDGSAGAVAGAAAAAVAPAAAAAVPTYAAAAAADAIAAITLVAMMH